MKVCRRKLRSVGWGQVQLWNDYEWLNMFNNSLTYLKKSNNAYKYGQNPYKNSNWTQYG